VLTEWYSEENVLKAAEKIAKELNTPKK